MITECKLKNKTAYSLLGLVAISALLIAAIGQPAMGQSMEPTQEHTTSMIAPIETILADNSYHDMDVARQTDRIITMRDGMIASDTGVKGNEEHGL